MGSKIESSCSSQNAIRVLKRSKRSKRIRTSNIDKKNLRAITDLIHKQRTRTNQSFLPFVDLPLLRSIYTTRRLLLSTILIFESSCLSLGEPLPWPAAISPLVANWMTGMEWGLPGFTVTLQNAPRPIMKRFVPRPVSWTFRD